MNYFEAIKHKNRWSIYDKQSRVYYTCKGKVDAMKRAETLNKEIK